MAEGETEKEYDTRKAIEELRGRFHSLTATLRASTQPPLEASLHFCQEFCQVSAPLRRSLIPGASQSLAAPSLSLPLWLPGRGCASTVRYNNVAKGGLAGELARLAGEDGGRRRGWRRRGKKEKSSALCRHSAANISPRLAHILQGGGRPRGERSRQRTSAAPCINGIFQARGANSRWMLLAGMQGPPLSCAVVMLCKKKKKKKGELR